MHAVEIFRKGHICGLGWVKTEHRASCTEAIDWRTEQTEASEEVNGITYRRVVKHTMFLYQETLISETLIYNHDTFWQGGGPVRREVYEWTPTRYESDLYERDKGERHYRARQGLRYLQYLTPARGERMSLLQVKKYFDLRKVIEGTSTHDLAETLNDQRWVEEYPKRVKEIRKEVKKVGGWRIFFTTLKNAQKWAESEMESCWRGEVRARMVEISKSCSENYSEIAARLSKRDRAEMRRIIRRYL